MKIFQSHLLFLWLILFSVSCSSGDKSIEGLKILEKNIKSVQFHPEANPGPRDSLWIFDEFLNGVKNG